MHRAQEVAISHLAQAARRNKEVYDTKLMHNNYQEGELVWWLTEARKVGVLPKLERMFAGPFVLKKRITPVNYMLQLDKHVKETLVHHNKLKRYEGSTAPKWTPKVSRQITSFSV